MGALSIYLLPEDEIDPSEYGLRVKTVLLEMGIIEDENYEHDDWWVAGESSGRIFEKEADGVGFEYCILYSSPYLELVPQDPAVSPACPSCGADVSGEYYEVVNQIELDNASQPARKEGAYIAATVSCPACAAMTLLPQLKDERGIFLSRTWVNFEDPNSSLRRDWLAAFEAATGWKHRCIEYWYT